MASVPPRFFHCPPLHATQREAYIHLALTSSQDTLLNALHMQRARATKVCTSKTTGATARICRGRDRLDKSVQGAVASTQLHGCRLDDVVAYFELDQLLQQKALGLVNGQTLYTLVDRSQTQPMHYVGLHWVACASPLVGVAPRDYCVLEYQDAFVYFDEVCGKERRGWLRMLHSIPSPSCPSLRSSHGLVRAELFRSGHVFIETDTPGVLDYHHVLCAKLHGSLPQFLAANTIVSQVSQVFCRRCCRVRGDDYICAACEAPQFTLSRAERSVKVRPSLRATQATDRSTQSSLLGDVAFSDPTPDDAACAIEGTFTFIASSRSLVVQPEIALLEPEPTTPLPPVERKRTLSDGVVPLLQHTQRDAAQASTKKLFVLYEDPLRPLEPSALDETLGTARLALQSQRSNQLYSILRSKYDAPDGTEHRKKVIERLCVDLLRPNETTTPTASV
ncbi:hypothetical protein SPRG_15304 [Saprolegnia parasitica CBS 223.65]|uniref:START domain-containing protein n=1 Tax=Saprolegnia parasitica (strain CBS 223.65) TaxID=695850 RepID=A0A067BMP6_SAPPC|nr:hypothetical protein SPRG_15304 [Saprolegnia parasitica CBS 223.65]KDO19498.1 hypothetical protein SPRG_15304 [Saprolegnia parasitica CBS 223.65]|eukprot:XP_012209801.1 hypothetical protein SPRG_15304 [Saprolegnia parasitica CBS 223.65]